MDADGLCNEPELRLTWPEGEGQSGEGAVFGKAQRAVSNKPWLNVGYN